MSFRRTGLRPSLALAAALLSGCGGGGAGVREGDPDAGSDVLKISHFRAFEHPQTKRLEPTYRVVFSESWRDRIGEVAREPFPLAAPSNIYRGYAPDGKMKHYIARLRDYGLDNLIPSNPDAYRPEELSRLSQHPQTSGYTRIFTVGSEKSARSYAYRDHHVPGREKLLESWLKCEAYILSIMNGHTIRIQTKSDPVFRKDP
jgi:hypothetical protein